MTARRFTYVFASAAPLVLALVVSGASPEAPPPAYASAAVAEAPLFTQPNPPLGLDRLGQRSGVRDHRYDYRLTGAGVHVYVVDSGIAPVDEFTGRLSPHGIDLIGTAAGPCLPDHGTQMAGTIGGTYFGVAKRVTLHSVRVLGCSGQLANPAIIVQGLSWVIANAKKPAIVNMSLAVRRNAQIDAKIAQGIAAGLTFVVAAGNDHPSFAGLQRNACKLSPAGVPGAITVGALDVMGTSILHGTFRGTCVDLFAPGDYIDTAAANGGSTQSSLTSIAAAHVSGVAALAMQAAIEGGKDTSPAAIWRAIDVAATVPVNPPGAGPKPNKILHWGAGSLDGLKDVP